ncbi:MAG: hypothetical protein A2V65_05410 [Deltaproteobacteria bacterium RBG_13_49_15]|nr:MAG: hypothetical protein A2V65_05410 [Deltaproteobacteria bacterium RBG_13_49_15]
MEMQTPMPPCKIASFLFNPLMFNGGIPVSALLLSLCARTGNCFGSRPVRLEAGLNAKEDLI